MNLTYWILVTLAWRFVLSANHSMSRMEWSLLLVLAVLWGASFFFGEIALTELPPLTLVFARVSIAAIVLHIVILAMGQRMPTDWRAWGSFITMGLLNNLIPFSLIFWGQTHIESGLASILNATTPIFTVVLAHVLTHDEKIRPSRAIGVVLGFAGVTVIIGPDALRDLGVQVWAQIAVLGAAASYAFAGVYGKRFRGRPPIVVAAGQLTSSTIMMLPVVFLMEQTWTMPIPSTMTWSAVLSLALLSTALAYIIYFRLLATAGPTNLLLVTFLIPITALILGYFFLSERLGLADFVGMGLIIAGLATIDGRLFGLVVARKQPNNTAPAASDDPQNHDYQI